MVNVVDLMRLQPDSEHPHGLSEQEFDALFTVGRPVIFAYHGYPWLIHRLTYRRANHANIHVRGYKEEGTTTTPFDMVMLNDLDRFHLVMDVIDRVPGLAERASHLRQHMIDRATAPPRLHPRAWRRPAGAAQLDVAGRRPTPPRRRRAGRRGVARMRVLVVNAGSSSLKLRLLDGEDAVLAEDELTAPRSEIDDAALGHALDSRLGQAQAIGHRIVHGGERFHAAVRIDAGVETRPSRADRPGTPPPAQVPGGAGRRQRRASRATRRGLL